MKKSFLVIFLFVCFVGYSQKETKNTVKIKSSKAIKVDWAKETKAHGCKETKLYDVKQRNSFYPFTHAFKIALVSFEDIDNYRDNYVPDTTFLNNGKYNTSYPSFQLFKFSSKHRNSNYMYKVDDFALPPFKKIVILSSSSRDSLSNILFNSKYLGHIRMSPEVKCYQPRNAILFYDKEGNLLEYLEICFNCSGRRLSWNNSNIDWCDSKYEKLGQLFRQSGIKFGTYEMTDKRNYVE